MNITPSFSRQSAAFVRATIAKLIAKYSEEAVGPHVIDALAPMTNGS